MKKVIFTGITPSGTLTLGNYIGVIKHLVSLQEEYLIFLMIADLHALTTITSKKVEYRERVRELASLLYSCGLKKENCKIFVQSEIKEHLELSYFLSSYCSVARLENMIQYKEKTQEGKYSNLSLFSYPVLMASDILLYDADLVIVGKDQKQHLELTEYLAKKFNASNQNCLKIPSFVIPEFASKIMGFRNPHKKMSKSGDDHISLLDSEQTVKSKVMRAETDSEQKIYYSPLRKAGISNLLTIYSAIEGMQIEETEKLFVDKNYSYLKEQVSNSISNLLLKIQEKFRTNLLEVDHLLEANSSLLRTVASQKIVIIKKMLNILSEK